MLFGSGMASLCMLAIGIANTVAGNSPPAGRCIVAFMVLYGFFYNGFSGTLSWPIATEVVSSRLRVITIGVGTGINYFFNCECQYTILLLAYTTDKCRAGFLHCTIFYQPSRPQLGGEVCLRMGCFKCLCVW